MNLEKIVKTKDYSRIAKNSKKLHSKSFLILYNLLTDLEVFKVGLTVSKRVGNAVKRNYCKRLIRVIVKGTFLQENLNPAELVIIAKPTILEQHYKDLRSEFIRGLKNLR